MTLVYVLNQMDQGLLLQLDLLWILGAKLITVQGI